MRVVTLLPGATEIVAAVGGAADLVGVSHECDYPPEVIHLPRVTTTPIDTSAPGAEIDAAVRRLRDAGRPIIAVEADALRRLAPDLLLTQSLCEVCAVEDGVVHRLAAAMAPPPRVLSLAGRDLPGIFADIRAVAGAIGRAREGEELLVRLRSRLDRLGTRRPAVRPRVVCIEWLEPLYLAGHWVPELVEAAGGVDAGATPGAHSMRRAWRELDDLAPDAAAVMLCGFDVSRARRELDALEDPEARAFLERVPVWLLDGNAYTSRPGPRVVDGAERLAAMLRGEPRPGLERWTVPWH